jgi:hypothetical protein
VTVLGWEKSGKINRFPAAFATPAVYSWADFRDVLLYAITEDKLASAAKRYRAASRRGLRVGTQLKRNH